MSDNSDGNLNQRQEHSTSGDRASTGKIVGLTIGAVVVVGALIFGGTLLYGKSQVDEIKDAMASSDSQSASVEGAAGSVNSVTRYDTADLEAMDSSEFRSLDANVRINHLARTLDGWRADTLAIMRKYMSPEQAALVDAQLPSNKSDYSDQDILNAYAIDVFDASVQGDTVKDNEEGRKLLSVVVDPDHPNYATLSAQIGNGKGGILSVFKASENSYPRIVSEKFMDLNVGSGGAAIIRNTGVQDGKEYLSLFELLRSSDGAQSWILKASYRPNDPAVAEAIQNIGR
ncbi:MULTISPECIES: hypothetical protein [unclassified Rhodococcus (in: high G+C Gram-positive bacteria)]|uniref:hypothetical protein n=1 Tax=unclassified Rhodococcus (in: high G+C Gram-positive bacteria) TaxID=192944 RepID=UPI0024B718EF|nr:MULTISPECIES: hypothetical protein [unclassified Rhodococcus (in: high G+C Gram-positive bacteria)]MDI9960738.1 hypothetical protein [Rhodococcus sp. IEGM 1237]MDI9966832.1 hypothetical protein [Rhodococcus sp. IEGM 1251]MDV8129185.1 hypothetical protein [Rhodococcus sp. IEGM 1304]